MASIFKRSKRKSEPYTIQYLDHDGKRKSVTGFTDKGLTEQLALKLETEARLRRSGMCPSMFLSGAMGRCFLRWLIRGSTGRCGMFLPKVCAAVSSARRWIWMLRGNSMSSAGWCFARRRNLTSSM